MLIVNALLFGFIVVLAYLNLIRFSEAARLGKRLDQFVCRQCGNCCTYLKINVNENDIQRIEKAGYRDFLTLDRKFVKRVGGRCFFLKRQGDKWACSIHKIKPSACAKWPRKRVFGMTVVRLPRRFECLGLKELKKR